MRTHPMRTLSPLSPDRRGRPHSAPAVRTRNRPTRPSCSRRNRTEPASGEQPAVQTGHQPRNRHAVQCRRGLSDPPAHDRGARRAGYSLDAGPPGIPDAIARRAAGRLRPAVGPSRLEARSGRTAATFRRCLSDGEPATGSRRKPLRRDMAVFGGRARRALLSGPTACRRCPGHGWITPEAFHEAPARSWRTICTVGRVHGRGARTRKAALLGKALPHDVSDSTQ